MRIVFDINTPRQSSGGGRPWRNLPGRMGYNGTHLDLIMCESPAANHPELPSGLFGGESDSPIYIEGDSIHIIPALEELLQICRFTEQHYQDQLGENRPTDCPDGCDGIEQFNGNHATTCPRHPKHESLNAQETK